MCLSLCYFPICASCAVGHIASKQKLSESPDQNCTLQGSEEASTSEPSQSGPPDSWPRHFYPHLLPQNGSMLSFLHGIGPSTSLGWCLAPQGFPGRQRNPQLPACLSPTPPERLEAPGTSASGLQQLVPVLPVPSCPTLPATSSLQALLQTADDPGALCSCQGLPQGPISQAALSSQQSWHVLCACAASRALPSPNDDPSIAAAVIQQTRCQHGTTLKPLLHSLPGHCSHQAGSHLDNLRSLSRAPRRSRTSEDNVRMGKLPGTLRWPDLPGPSKALLERGRFQLMQYQEFHRRCLASRLPPWVSAHWGTAAS